MEAFAALGLAAAVIQFVDFSSKLVSKGQQLYHSTDGALLENTEMEEASKRLDKVTAVSIQQDARFKSWDTVTRQIVDALLNLPTTVRGDMDNQFQHLIRYEHLEHSKTRAAFVDHTKTQLDNRVCQSIIESLRFPERTVRHETVPQAHKRTFEWIFRDPVADGKPWSDFGHWLETGAGIYWINGKAGSGKSTLMKFIVDHEMTRRMLRIWARNDDLETPSFFFWKSGKSIQRSQEGLLRSLLYEVLLKHPELVPISFPETWSRNSELASHNIPHIPSIWTLSKLKESFSDLVACRHLKMCFFIDGLDEYEGDYDELAEYIGQLSCSANVKLCLSSRPWPAFQDAFRKLAGLKLQDLTSDDIKQYINDKINKNEKIELLKLREPVRVEILTNQLIQKAEGVFLWVTLVVKSLLKGLRNRNDLERLEKKLDALPSELEALYGHMLSSIDPDEMKQGSKIFQLFEASGSSRDMELIYFALTGALIEPLNLPLPIIGHNLQEVQHIHLDSIFEEMGIFLQVCCGGLIEIIILEGTKQSWRQGELSYIHRTVKDYLNTREARNRLASYTSRASWDSQKSLLNATLMCLRNISCLGREGRVKSKDYVESHWDQFVTHTFLFSEEGSLSYDECIHLLDNFDRAATYVAHCCCWNQNNAKAELHHWSNNIKQPALPRRNFLSLAADNKLWFYVKRQLEENPALMAQKLEVPLLAHALLQIGPMNFTRQPLLKTVKVILSFSADPNEVFWGHSLWQYWVTILHAAAAGGYICGVKLLQKVTMEMLAAGVDLEAECVEGSTAWRDLYQEIRIGDDFEKTYVSRATINVSDLLNHSTEAWRDPEEYSQEIRCDRRLFAGEENHPFGERHCLRAVIEHAWRKRDSKGTDEVLQFIEKLEAEKVSRECDVPIRERVVKKAEGHVD
ncbi:hypothetical protein DL98DRAFT_584281 [Cadophora sp. DSE1049]|nr:hypothetical protein DL98DRAFT_584281 [Cadophora sp. DSE1049]